MRASRTVSLVAGLLATAGAITVVSVAPASGDDGARPIAYHEHSPLTPANFDAAFVDDFSRCTFTPTFEIVDPCVDPIVPVPGFDGVLSGDLVGTRPSADAAALAVVVKATATEVDVPSVQFTKFIGSVKGCGTGSYVFRIDSTLNDPNSSWTIVPHSGRGDLAGISGHGTAVSTISATGLETDAVGRIRCGKHHGD